jgi:hypothetical protein
VLTLMVGEDKKTAWIRSPFDGNHCCFQANQTALSSLDILIMTDFGFDYVRCGSIAREPVRADPTRWQQFPETRHDFTSYRIRASVARMR